MAINDPSTAVLDGDSYQLLQGLADTGQFEQVIERAYELIGRFPVDWRVPAILGGSLLRMGRTAEAVGILHRVLAIAPDQVDALYNLGLAHYTLDEFEQAAALSRRLLALHPEHAGALQNLFLALARVEALDEEEAKIVFGNFHRKFLQKHPGLTVEVLPALPLDNWCASNNIPMHVLDVPEQVGVTDPESGRTHTYQTEGARFAVIPDATVIPGWDFVVSPTDHVLDGSGYMDLTLMNYRAPHLYNRPQQRVVLPWRPECTVVDADALFLSAPPDMHFGHWIVDFLPRLRAWSKSALRRKIVIPDWLPQHHRDTLLGFGVAGEDLILCEVGKHYQFKTLMVVRPGDFYRPSANFVHHLYGGLGPSPLQENAQPGKRRVFLARSKTARGRNIVNQDELDAVLADTGIETMRRPDTSIGDQNQILGDAGVVLTTYGTDVLALYQLRPGTDLVVLYYESMSLMDRELGSLAMARMCETLGIRLHRIPCASVASLNRSYYKDLLVDPAAVRAKLREILDRGDSLPH